MPEIPPEAQALIADFKKSEAERQAGRPSKPASNGRRKDLSEIRGCMSYGDMIRLAIQKGFDVTYGNGNHGTHLVASDGSECAVPNHGKGKSLTTGVQHNCLKWMVQHGDQ